MALYDNSKWHFSLERKKVNDRKIKSSHSDIFFHKESPRLSRITTIFVFIYIEPQ